MNTYLVFRLYSPLCSWGDIAVGETRPSFIYPSKSTILGLLAAAIGIKRDEESKQMDLTNSFAFGVCVQSYGSPLFDYHTIQVLPRNLAKQQHIMTRKDELISYPEKLETILSNRSYRCDAVYILMLQQLDNAVYTVESGSQSLINPKFHLYLGRKSCPLAIPCQPHVVKDAVNGLSALKKAKEIFNKLAINSITMLEKEELFWENSFNMGITPTQIFERRDNIISRKSWQFDIRMENHATLGG